MRGVLHEIGTNGPQLKAESCFPAEPAGFHSVLPCRSRASTAAFRHRLDACLTLLNALECLAIHPCRDCS
jgi:hypothetical protein